MPLAHLALVLLICVVWGSNFLTSAIALQQVGPFAFTTMRMAALAVLLLPLLKWPPHNQRMRLFVVGITNGALHFGLSYWSLKLAGNLASPAILLQTYIPMTAILAAVVLKEHIGWKTGSGIALSFVGVMVLGFDPVVLAQPLSLFLMLAAAFFAAVGTVAMRPLKGVNVWNQQAWTAIVSILPMLAFTLMMETSQVAAVMNADWRVWFGLAWAVLLSSLVGHGLFYWLVQQHEVSKITPLLIIAPVIAVALGILFYGDELSPRIVFGGLLILGGVLVVSIRAKARRSRAQHAEPSLDETTEI